MNWRGKTVLVTGAGGFIGSHLAEHLLALGARPRGLVHYNSRGSWGWLDESPVKDDIDIRIGDVTDRDSVGAAMQGVDIVFHLAALIGIPYSYHAPMSYVRTNVEGTLNVLLEALRAGVERVVHTSTSEVYGTALYVPIDEQHPLRGQSPYSASKIAGDKMAEAFQLSFAVPVVTVRPFNTYGPRQSARALIPTIITQLSQGETVRLGHLDPTRDLVYVEDTVDGFVRAGSCSGAVGRTINLGTGTEISVRSLASRIASLMGRSIKIVSDRERARPEKSEVARLCASNALAREVLDWRPQHSLDDGLRATIQWIGDHLEQYKADRYAI